MDTYQGSTFDPVSLHKYLYANANPVMYVDPSGYNSLTSQQVATAGMAVIAAIIVTNDNWAMNVYKNIRSSFAANSYFVPKYIFQIDDIFIMQIASGLLTSADANDEVSSEITSGATSGTGAAAPDPKNNKNKKNKKKNEVDNEQNQKSQNDQNNSFVKHGHSKPPKQGVPNTVYEQLNPDGTVRSRAFYDENGRIFNRQDFDHTHFDKFTDQDLTAHEHYFKYNEFGKPVKTKPGTGVLPDGYNNLPNWF